MTWKSNIRKVWKRREGNDPPRNQTPPKQPVPKAPPPEKRQGRPVVLIHGLNMPPAYLYPIKWRLSRSLQRPVLSFPYFSHFSDIPATALKLARWMDQKRITEFDAVTHSMGGVILRWAMSHCDMPRLHRAVMIAPPNEGSWLATRLHQRLGLVYPLCFGQAGLQLRSGELGLASQAGDLAGAEAGVIAGGCGSPEGIRNWFKIPGDCDGTVAVEETIFPGMKDFVLLPGNHTMISFNKRTADLTRVFLETGLFRPGRKQISH